MFSLAGEDKYYTPGNKRFIASIKGWRINLQICYDLRFPVWSRQQHKKDGQEPVVAEYDLLLYVANWPQARINVWQTLLAARAIENQTFVVGVNRIGQDAKGNMYTGSTQVLDALGNKILDAGNEAGAKIVTLHKNALQDAREQFSFLKDADSFLIY